MIFPDLMEQLGEYIRHLQRELKMLETDLNSDLEHLEHLPPSIPAKVELPTKLHQALEQAGLEWEMDVAEPKGNNWERIDDYIRSAQGLGWDWEEPYTKNGQFAWCGAFAAFCLATAGLKPEIRKKVMPSCYRINEWAKGTPRMITPAEAMPGDVAIVGPADGSGKSWGNHVTLCRGQEVGAILTYEGNAKGPGPSGNAREGVIKRSRPFSGTGRTYIVLYTVRFLAEDFE